MSKRNCLTCVHEPMWGALKGARYKYRTAICHYDVNKIEIKLPGKHKFSIDKIIAKYENSCLFYHCPAWKPKNIKKMIND